MRQQNQQNLPVSCTLNETARSVPFPLISRSLPVQKPFVFFTTSVRSSCTFSVHFESVSYSFHLLHMAVYYFYSLLTHSRARVIIKCKHSWAGNFGSDNNLLKLMHRVAFKNISKGGIFLCEKCNLRGASSVRKYTVM